MKRPLCVFCLLVSFTIILLTSCKSTRTVSSHSEYIGSRLTYKGTVSDLVYKETDYSSYYVLYLHDVVALDCSISNTKHKINAIAYIDKLDITPKIGSIVTLSGKAYEFKEATNEGMLNEKKYYQSLNYSFAIKDSKIISTSNSYNHLRNSLFNIRNILSAKLNELLPCREEALAKAILLGDKSSLDHQTKDFYSKNGIAHILSISGFHISLLGLYLSGIFKKLGIGLKKGKIISLTIIFLYGLMTGFSISTIRAVFMYMLSVAGTCLNRSYDILTSVSFSMMLSLIINPMIIYNSGFIFSYGSVIGITILSMTFTSKNMSFPNKTCINILTTSVTILPLYLYNYYQLPVYSFIINMLIIPLMSLIIPLGIFMLVFSFFSFFISKLIAIPILGLLHMIDITGYFASMQPFYLLTLGKPHFILILIYISGITLLYFFRNKLTLASKALIALLLMGFLVIKVRPPLEISFLDVGQGDCIYINYSDWISLPYVSDDCSIIIDCGSTSANKVGQNRLVPLIKYKGVSDIDALIFTHEDLDHINGLLELMRISLEEGIKIKRIILPYTLLNEDGSTLEEIIYLAENNNINITYFSKGNIIEFKDLSLKCLSPLPDNIYENQNEASLVMYLEYRDFTALFTGDIEGSSEKTLTETLITDGIRNISLLKVAHHGSKNSSSPNFIHEVNPQISVISAGKNNKYNHPHEETINILNEVNSKILCTIDYGEITIRTDGKKMQIKTFQN